MATMHGAAAAQAGQARLELVGRGPGQPLRRRDASTLTRTRRTLRDFPKQWRQPRRPGAETKPTPMGDAAPRPLTLTLSASARLPGPSPLSRPRRLIVLVLGRGIPPGATRRGARRQLARPGSTNPNRPCGPSRRGGVATCKFSSHACMQRTLAGGSLLCFPASGIAKGGLAPPAPRRRWRRLPTGTGRTACSASACIGL